jgi:hypothetical protein
MGCRRGIRNWVLTALLLAGCGSAPEPRKRAVSPLVGRCHLGTVDGGGGFPAKLLPPQAAVTGDGVALVPGRLAAVYALLKQRAAAAGLSLTGSELETLDAELEFGDVGLSLSIPRACARATQVALAG